MNVGGKMFNFFNSTYNSNNIENKNQSLYKNTTNQNNLGETLQEKNPVQVNATMDFDTLQKARQDLVGEIQAVIEYDEHIRNTTNKLARETWENIKHEELTHAGELMALINHLDPTQRQYVENGFKEFTERMNRM